MDDPTHANENRFWDDVADWVLQSKDDSDRNSPQAALEAMRRDLQNLRDQLRPY